ncbi:hypothetical protein [Bacillus halotolerans]|uniref:Uncharacterized protein n=1 Tax=Bacillus halotolerans TaxID=260554 RepID=A0A9Q4EPG2_9BACI|nr:hypothetical protein [Bacillus halotolerans]MCY9186573.1 hypothetical protein [Bacillus halotolerans]
MLQSNRPLSKVAEPSLLNEMVSGALTGAMATGVMQAGFYGMSKVKSEKPILKSMQRYSKGAYAHGYGNLKRTAITYGVGAIADGLLHGAMYKSGM